MDWDWQKNYLILKEEIFKPLFYRITGIMNYLPFFVNSDTE